MLHSFHKITAHTRVSIKSILEIVSKFSYLPSFKYVLKYSIVYIFMLVKLNKTKENPRVCAHLKLKLELFTG